MKDKKQLLSPIQKFINTKSLGGIVLLLATLLALVMANSPLSDFYHSIWKFEIGIKSEGYSFVKPLILWINDGLMAIFFFLIGLEIKRELLVGELNTVRKATLPVFAAIGGMVVPVIIFLILNSNPETTKGWGMSMATDIAFSLAVLKILGKKVPLGLKIFLTAFAIIDDIGAVIVIAIFYTNDIAWHLIIIAGVLLFILYVMSYKQIHNKYIISVFGVIIWILFLKSGIHPTIAGILLAFAIPIRQKINEYIYSDRLKELVDKITHEQNTNKLPVLTEKQIELLDGLEDLTHKVQSPLQQLEHSLHNWVAFLIMPIFAFANAGIVFGDAHQLDFNLVFNIGFALFFGKLIGISLFSFIAVKAKLAEFPKGVDFYQVIGVSLLAAIGFTMSLFIGNLAFIDNHLYLNSAKMGVVIASFLAAILGYMLLKIVTNKSKEEII